MSNRATIVSIPFLALALGGPATSQAPAGFKLTASDAATDDQFGFSVAVSGDIAVVGAQFDDDAGNRSGSAYVFVRGGASWTEEAKLTASDAAAEDRFGWSVAVSGETVLVGARSGDSASLDSGSAYVFVRSGMSWIEQSKLTASDAAAGDGFGESVAVSGNTALVGARHDDDDGIGSGSAYVFVRSGGSWTEQGKLTASDAAAGDRFGLAVATSGDTAIVGAERDDDAGTSSGSAYVFVRGGTNWTEQAKLTASDAAGGDSFGASVAVSGDVALVGAPHDGDAGNSSGSAYLFVRGGPAWIQQAKLTASAAGPTEFFGFSVAVGGDAALVGASFGKAAGNVSGSAYAYRLAIDLARWSQFGAGCAGTLAVPVLQPAVGSTPKTGGTFDVVLSPLPANNRAFLILGLSSTQWLSIGLPMSLASFGAPDCSLLVSGDFFTGVVNTTGTAAQGFPIPLDPTLVGLRIYFQGYVEDPGANLFGVAVSNGLVITIGS